MPYTIAFVVAAVLLRLGSLAISVRNERGLLLSGAVEHGAVTTKVLALAHAAFYAAAITEAILQPAPASWITWTGLTVYALSMCALFWVIRTLGRVWTVKLYIAEDHHLETNWLFRRVRHPNYYLNIVPELIGFALTLQAFTTLSVGLPVYAVILFLRIRQEEQVMRERFPEY
ncbi:hypothetical protein NUH88_06430 [Nisaea acidiphila]|uniref:Isoprenylcysteine carboxyl methyltransferase n=1 Tax=Nisaea acidiphila TaxID=1862145 RepID=A0A9J7AVG0_9PROT|nr:isoprenylcysteine carboxylmethyltransferase family protein [Nisaea acidiphila]UUX51327.1 hypothetical protein NUH88_06430 [Nisaea acidiphila]